MSHTLESLATDCREALKAEPGPDGLEKVRRLLAEALKDPDFVAATVGGELEGERNLLYEDPELKFCIFGHVYDGPKGGKPHDHGPTWAVYGQALGETEMTDYEIIEPPHDGEPGKVKAVRNYAMKPGDARAYQIGDVHCPNRKGPVRLIRIEGQNCDFIERTPLELA